MTKVDRVTAGKSILANEENRLMRLTSWLQGWRKKARAKETYMALCKSLKRFSRRWQQIRPCWASLVAWKHYLTAAQTVWMHPRGDQSKQTAFFFYLCTLIISIDDFCSVAFNFVAGIFHLFWLKHLSELETFTVYFVRKLGRYTGACFNHCEVRENITSVRWGKGAGSVNISVYTTVCSCHRRKCQSANI